AMDKCGVPLQVSEKRECALQLCNCWSSEIFDGEMEVANVCIRQQLLLVLLVGVFIEANNAVNAIICEVLHSGRSELLGIVPMFIVWGRGAVEFVPVSDIL